MTKSTTLTKIEAAAIRAKLQLRKSELTGEWEVYTTADSGKTFKWFKCSAEMAKWYSKELNVVTFLCELPHITSGELTYQRKTGPMGSS